MQNDFITRLIRTWTPMIVGAIAGWLTASGANLEPEAIAGLTAFLVGLFSTTYYLAARLLEEHFPQLSFLLGSSKDPVRDPNVQE